MTFAPEIFYGVGAFLLLAVMAYAFWRDSTRDRRKDGLTDAATREQYRHPESYQQTQKQFEDAAKD